MDQRDDNNPSSGYRKERRSGHVNRTLKGREVIFRDFKRFMQTVNIPLVGLQQKDMKTYYEEDYKAYRRQIVPDEPFPSFSSLRIMILQKGIGHFRTGVFSFGRPTRRSRNRGQRARQSSEGGSEGASKDGEIIYSHGQNEETIYLRRQLQKQLRAEMFKIAVDQHITTRPPKTPSTIQKKDAQAPLESSDDELYAANAEIRGKFHVCKICQVECSCRRDVILHLRGKKHRLAESIHLLKQRRQELIQGSDGIEITSSLPGTEGTLRIETEPRKVIQSEVMVTNKGMCDVELLYCEQMKSMRVFVLNDSKKVTDGLGHKVLLKPGDNYKIQVRTTADHLGTYHCPIFFKFNVLDQTDGSSSRPCYMVRYLLARCTDSLVAELQPTVPYKKPPRVAKRKGKFVEIEPGLKCLKNSGSDCLEREEPLPSFTVPPDLRKLINRGLTNEAHLADGEKVELNNLRSILEQPLSMDVYRRRFDALLYLEEVQMDVDIRKYDMEGVPLTYYPHNKRLLALKVPGLSENRPSVLKGDWLFVQECLPDGGLGEKEYQGFVHEIALNEVALGFNERFRNKWIPNMKFNVRFVFNRLPLKLQHRSCQLACDQGLGPLLFPNGLLKKETPLPKLKLYNAELEKNEKQLCAVRHIVAGTSCPAPYIIFGPPGTGKTVTVVEAMKQVWKSSKSTHILACTPSNSAADLISQRLLQHVDKKDIIRLSACSRAWKPVPDDIKEICNYDAMHGEYYYPAKADLMDYRIVVSTLVTAGRLASAQFPAGHFTHVFIDEGGHAVEPEAVISLAGILDSPHLMNREVQVVLAGDPKQLGPVLRSPLATDYGLDISLLERLMISSDLYQPMSVDGHKRYDVRVITKLLKNYRSHPDILELPNGMFYDAELEACANPIVREKLCRWEGLPKAGFPVVFHSVLGKDLREERSPSFFNAEEVSVVISYVEDLLSCKKGGINVKQEDIGIVAPYRKQVEKIKQVLRKKQLDKITVGSVEEFQGQERTVIIVTTVRSKPEYMSLDLTYNLGFLRNPKRFNVTVTRAKALLVVIGNPNTLAKDPHWRQLIEFCERAGSYKGIQRMTEDDEMEDLTQRLNAVGIIDENLNLVPEVRADFNEQPWRGDH